MKQAIHIFKKDVRYLRYDVAFALLAAMAFCLTTIHNLRGPGPVAVILPVTWWFLIGRVIHAEALPGNRQFWLTRPYQWQSLLGAKLLFILAFVNTPLLIADAVIIGAAGFSIGAELGGLLWMQLLLLAAFVLPTAAFSAITSGLTELLMVTLLLIVGVLARILVSPLLSWGDFSWMELGWVKICYVAAQIAATAAIILLWQYARRNTFAARTLTGAIVLALLASSALLPWTAAFTLQTYFSRRKIDISSVRIELDSDRKWLGRIYATEGGQIVAELPLRISGLPTGTELKPNGLTVKLHAPDGETSVVHQPPPYSFNFESGILSLRAVMGKAFYKRAKDKPLQLRGKLYFTLYGNRQQVSIPVNGRSVPVKGVGLCSADASFLLCRSAFRPPSDWVTIRMLQDSSNGAKATTEDFSHRTSYSPFPAELSIDPLYRFLSPRVNATVEARVQVWEPFVHLERNFELYDVRLNDFAASSLSAVRK